VSASEGIDDALTGIRERHVRSGGPHVAGLLALASAGEVNVDLDTGTACPARRAGGRRGAALSARPVPQGRDESAARHETSRHGRTIVHDLPWRDRQGLLTLRLHHRPDLTITLFQEMTQALLNPTVQSLDPYFEDPTQRALPTILPYAQSLLLIWSHVVLLLTGAVICFAAAYVSFMRQEIRA